MRKHAKKARNSGKKFRRLSFITVIVATAILVIGAVTVVISRQNGSVRGSSDPERRSPVANKAGKNFVKVEVGGQEVQVDGETGQIGKLTPEEARKLAAGFKQLVNKSGSDLDAVRDADGSLSVKADGHFQSVAVAKENEDGTITQGCVDSPKAAADFFGIDRALFETDSPKVRKKVTPVKNQD